MTDLLLKVEGESAPKKTFKDYAPGFLHADIKYLPLMPDEDDRRDLFVAIDRTTRWVFLCIYADQRMWSSTDFLRRLQWAAPMKILKLLTDNGSQFSDRFTWKLKAPSGTQMLTTTSFVSGEELDTMIKRYAVHYNQHIPQKAIDHKTPCDPCAIGRKKTSGFIRHEDS
jgi:hypothetical protein